MTEIEELSVEDQLRDELRTVRHDLEHVTTERDQALKERDWAREERDLLAAELASTGVGEYIVANQKLAKKLALAEDRIQAVLGYVAKLECTNCEHVHEEGCCDFAYEGGGVCRCGWGPPQVAVDIRDLLKEQP